MHEKRPRRIRLGKHLSIKADYLPAIFRGEKITTIRRGIVVPIYDRVYLHSKGKVIGEVEIESTKYVKVRDLTDKDALLDGFKNKRELMENLRKFYPDINEEDWVTILRFKLVRKIKEEDKDHYIYYGYTPREIAKLALAYDVASNSEEKRILALVLTKNSIREAAIQLGGLHNRNKIRNILRSCTEKLLKMGVIKPKK